MIEPVSFEQGNRRLNRLAALLEVEHKKHLRRKKNPKKGNRKTPISPLPLFESCDAVTIYAEATPSRWAMKTDVPSLLRNSAGNYLYDMAFDFGISIQDAVALFGWSNSTQSALELAKRVREFVKRRVKP